MQTIFRQKQNTKWKYCKEILNYINTQCLITCLCWLLGRMQNKYFVNTRTVLESAIFGSINHSIFSGKCTIPIPALLPCCLSPSPRYYRGVCPHPHGITVNSVPITADLPRLPRFSRCPIPMQLSGRGRRTRASRRLATKTSPTTTRAGGAPLHATV